VIVPNNAASDKKNAVSKMRNADLRSFFRRSAPMAAIEKIRLKTPQTIIKTTREFSIVILSIYYYFRERIDIRLYWLICLL
jgi:hypothetical protein